MEVNIIKSGRWAFRGIEILDIKEGLQDINDRLAKELIDNGWAEPYSDILDTIEGLVEGVDIKTPAVESVKKKKAGWWYVKYEGRDEVVKVRGADDKDEAIILANAELEVE